jgi:hypothetical protein
MSAAARRAGRSAMVAWRTPVGRVALIIATAASRHRARAIADRKCRQRLRRMNDGGGARIGDVRPIDVVRQAAVGAWW